MTRIWRAWIGLAAIWMLYAIACGVSYGAPAVIVGWASTTSVTAGRKLRVGYTVTRLQLCELTRFVTVVDGAGIRHE